MKNRWMVVFLFCVTFLLAGCVSVEEPPTGKLTIRNISRCSAVSDDGQYEVQPFAVFDRGDTVFIYFEVYGFTRNKVDNRIESWIKCSEFKLSNPDKEIIVNVVNWGELKATNVPVDFDICWFCIDYDSRVTDPVGEYKVEFTIKDELSGAMVTETTFFGLK